MKGKLFVAALATMAMAACTQDDLQSVSQSGQVSPIQFTVTQDVDALTRTELANNYALLWKEGDQMSLFHGLGANITDISTFSPSYAHNAIYKAAAGKADDGLTFTTHSMVKSGPAIMVYPCDTVFDYTGTELYVTIPVEQSEENILGRIPFMSELMTIPVYNGTTGDAGTTAGYGRDYPIKLKQVATIFSLNTNYGVTDAYGIVQGLVDDREIDPIDINYVTITSSNKFNIKALVGYSDKASGINVQGEKWIDRTEDGFEWSYVSNVAKEEDGTNSGTEVKQENTLKSTFIRDVVDNKGKVEFILLPQKAVDKDTEENKWNNLTGTVTVNTYYGEVTYDQTKTIDDENIFWKEDDADWAYAKDGLNVAQGLNEVMSYTTATKKDDGITSFVNEEVGVHVTRTLNVNLYDLDMSKVHIKSDKQLRDILKVYEALGFDRKYSSSNLLNLTVDGDKNGEFRMSMEAVATLQSKGFEDIRIVPCQKPEEKCSKIVLFSDDTKENVVPSVLFVTTNAVRLVLDEANTWTWDNEEEYTYINYIENRGTLNLDNGDAVKDHDGNGTNPTLINQGTINVSGLVMMQTNLNNYGVINIGAEGVSGELRADGKNPNNNNVTITNNATSEVKLGKVYNYGIFATSNNGEIYNYGYIENMVGGTGNIIYVTKNATDGAEFDTRWSETNKIGTIKLFAADDNISVNNATAEGFIQYEFDAEDGIYVTPAVCKYNYLIVKKDITFNANAPELQFMEVVNPSKADMVVITNPADKDLRYLTLEGFILKGYANVMENNKLVTSAAYIQGALYYGGAFVKSGGTDLPKTTDVYFGDSEPADGDNTYLVEY